MAEKKGNKFAELFEMENGSVANTGEMPEEPIEEDDMAVNDDDLKGIADDLAAALVGAMDQVIGSGGAEVDTGDLGQVPDMLDKVPGDVPNDNPEGDPEQELPAPDAAAPAPASNDEPDGVDMPDRKTDDEDESAEMPGEAGGDDAVHDKLDSLEAKVDALLKDSQGSEDQPVQEEKDENPMMDNSGSDEDNKAIDEMLQRITGRKPL